MEVLTAVDRERLAALRQADEFFWLDLRKPTPGDLDALGEALELHPLALEDTREWGQRPKADPYGDHVFLVFYTVAGAGGPDVRSIEVHVYVAGGFVVTARRGECTEMDLLHERLGPARLEETEEYFVYKILDGLTDAYYPLIEATEERIDALEGEVLGRPQRAHLELIYRLKQEVHVFERRILAQRDYFPAAVNAMMELPGLSRGTRIYLRDVSDHLAQVAGELHRQSSDLTALSDTFFNANANKLNESVARLSVIATFFVAATLITGFFGQNFGWLVANIDSRTDFVVFGVGGLLLPVALLSVFFWRRRDEGP